MGERLRVDTADLEKAGSGLRTVATELEGLDKLMDAYDRRTVGHQQLHERLQDFSDGWDDNRKKMIEEIQGLGNVAHESAKAYKELDLRTEDPEAWAREVAAEHLAEDAPVELRDAFATDVLWYWAVAVRQRALCAAVLAPPESAVIASYTVRELRIPPESLSVAAFRAEAARAEGPYFGEQGLTQVELPLGPALRVHRLEPTAPDADSGTIVEGVAHYVLPHAHPTALECRLLWSTLGFGEELEKTADELANSVLLE